MLIEDNSILQTNGTGAITISGTGADGPYYDEGIYFGDSTLQTNAGTIALTGIGGSTQYSSAGLDIEGGTIQTTGGDIDLTGTGGTGPSSFSAGMYLSGDWNSNAPLTIQTQSGNITLSGTGGSGSYQEAGIWIDGGATIAATGTGNITLNGIAGNGTDGGNQYYANVGVMMMNDGYPGNAEAVVRVHDGNLSINGTGNGAGTHNDGIFLDGGAVIDSTGAGSITLTGHGPNSAAGIAFNNDYGSINAIGSGSTHGDITLIADNIDSSALSGIQTTGNVTFAPYTDGTTIGVGSGTGTLATNDALLALTSFGGTLTIGSGNSGDMDINSGSAILNQGNVTFISGGDIEVAGSITKSAGADASLTLEAYRNIALDPGVQISSTHNKLGVTLDADHTGIGSGSIYLASGSGITSNGGNITLGGGANPLITPAYGNNSFTGEWSDTFAIGLNGAQLLAGGGNISLTGTGWSGVPNNGNYGVYIWSNSLLKTTGTGSISITGIGGNPGPSIGSEGVAIYDASTLQTDAGAITLTGTGIGGPFSACSGCGWSNGIDLEGNSNNNTFCVIQTNSGDITIVGAAGPGGGGQSGVYASYQVIQTTNGNITITGTGADSGYFQEGIWVDAGTTIRATGTGNVSLIGTGGNGTDGTPGNGNSGVYVSRDGSNANDSIQVNNGQLSIIGLGRGAGTDNYGIWLVGGATIDSTGEGSILLNGYGNNGAAGIAFDSSRDSNPNIIGSGSTHGDVTLVADSLDISNLGGIQTTGNVTFAPYTSGTTIGVGSGTGTLAINDALLGLTSFGGTLTIGSGNSGDMDINSGSSILNQGNVAFISGGDIEVAGNLAKSAGGDSSLTFDAFRNISIDTGVQISSTSNKLNVTLDADHTGVGSGAIYLASGSEISSNGGDITLGGGSNPLTTPAYGNATHTIGINLDNATLNADEGNISIIGTGYDGMTGGNGGIYLTSATVETSGGGTVTMTGTGDGKGENNSGIFVDSGSTIASGTGNITLTGTGSQAEDNVSSNNAITSPNYGIYSGGSITSSGGGIHLTGTGGTYGNNSFYYGSSGIWLDWASVISTSGSGAITLTGTGTSLEGFENHGVLADGTISNGTGDITITGTGSHSGGQSNYGVYICCDDPADGYPGLIISHGGNITIAGTGDPYSDHGSTGVVMEGGISTTATGSISITGIGGGQLNRDGFNNGRSSDGVDIYGSLSTATGNITLTGTGGGNATSIAGSHGVYICCGDPVEADEVPGSISSLGGNITVTGTGGSGISQGLSGSFYDSLVGVYSDSNAAYGSTGISSITTTGNGNISITGTGGGTGNDNFGVYNVGTVSAQNGNITISGTGSSTGADVNHGVFVDTGGSVATIGAGSISITGIKGAGVGSYALDIVPSDGVQTSGTGNITINANTLSLSVADNIDSSGNLTIRPSTAGTTIGVGTGSSSLQLTDDLLSSLAYGSLTIGGSNAGAMDINTGAAFTGPVTFISGSGTDITLDGALTSSAAGTAFTLASGRNFINDAGASVFDLTGGGRWLIYSINPGNDSADGLTSDFTRTSCIYESSCPSFPGTGNGFLYSYTPLATVNAVASPSPPVILPSTVQNILSHSAPASGESPYAPSGLIIVDSSLFEMLGADQDAPWWDGVER